MIRELSLVPVVYTTTSQAWTDDKKQIWSKL